MGRKEKSAAQQRKGVYPVRLNEREEDTIGFEARLKGLEVASWLRMVGLDRAREEKLKRERGET